ncbi:hypothetical protein AKJ09_02116 [Labilithrix luteola]|uniref:Uncharacterized protein n=1 Tax=Labilithrix luteola TaxID=1391654 RepID=A0A0K1PPK6_9BACT|nr:hypothetical protein AKJ09_02116 [Labilithrix luteola]
MSTSSRAAHTRADIGGAIESSARMGNNRSNQVSGGRQLAEDSQPRRTLFEALAR